MVDTIIRRDVYQQRYQPGIISNERHQPDQSKTGAYMLRFDHTCDLTPDTRWQYDHSKNNPAGTKYSPCPGVRHSLCFIVSHIQRISGRPIKKHRSYYFDFTNAEHTYRIHPTFHSRPVSHSFRCKLKVDFGIPWNF